MVNYNWGDLIEKVAQSFGIETCWKCKWRKANANVIGKVVRHAIHDHDPQRRRFLLKAAAGGVLLLVGARPAWATNLWQSGCGCLPPPIDIFNCASASKISVRYNLANGPKPTSNGCTGWPEGFWGGCCDLHDGWFADCAMTIGEAGARFKNCINDKCAENSPTFSLYLSCLAMSNSMAWTATETFFARNLWIKEQNRVCGCKPCGWNFPCNYASTPTGGLPREPASLPGYEPIAPGTGGL